MIQETPDSPTHWAYPPQLRYQFSDGNSRALNLGVLVEIERALENINGEMRTGADGWGVSFDEPSDKVMFFLQFDWSKFA